MAAAALGSASAGRGGRGFVPAGRDVQGWLAWGERGSGSPFCMVTGCFYSIVGARNVYSRVSSATELRSRTEVVGIAPSVVSPGQPALSIALLPLGSGAWRAEQPADWRGCLPLVQKLRLLW